MKIFISYGRNDAKDFACHLYNSLTSTYDLNVFVDTEEIPKGKNWNDYIFKDIKSSNYFVLILTNGAINSSMVNEEVNYAKSLETLNIVPYKFHTLNWNKVRWNLSNINGNDFETKEDLVRKVVDDIVIKNSIQSISLKVSNNIINPEIHKEEFEKAAKLSKINQFKESNKILEKMQQKEFVLTLQAWNYMGLRDHQKAINFCEKAIELNPNSFLGWFYKSTCLGILGKIQEALSSIDKAISINPESTDALYTKGLCFLNSAKYDEAINEFNKVIRLNQYSDDAWINIGVALIELKKYNSGNKMFEKAISIYPNDSRTWSNNAHTLFQLKKYEDCLENLIVALELDLRNPYAWYSSALLLERMGLCSEADRCFDICKRLNHPLPIVRLVFGETISKVLNNKLIRKTPRLNELVNIYHDQFTNDE